MRYRWFALLLLAIGLTGCQQWQQKEAFYLHRGALDYRSSTLLAPLKVPSDLSLPAATESFPLPAHLPSRHSWQAVDLRPPGFGQLNVASAESKE